MGIGSLNKPSRNHHFVPASLLRYFSIGDLGKQIHIFDKRLGKSFTNAVENAGSQNDFNKLRTPDGDWNFEHIFEDVDGTLHALLKDIHATRDINFISPQARFAWADVLATQLIRTPLTRSSLIAAAEDLGRSLSDAKLAEPNAFAPITDNDSRRINVETWLERAPFRQALQEKDFVLFEASGAARFVTSDHPIIIESCVPYGDRGLASPGTAVYFPLGPNLLLGLLCKSISHGLNARPLEFLDVDPQLAADFMSLRDGMRNGKPIRRSDAWVDAMNQRQIAHSARFIYSNEDASHTIVPMLAQHPELRDVRTHIHVGRMGHAPPPSAQMPPGLWLILFGRGGHYIIKASDWSDEDFPLEVTIDDIGAMNRALADGPFSEMRIYIDRSPIRMMREVKVEIVSAHPPVRVRITRSDPSLAALVEAIDAGRLRGS